MEISHSQKELSDTILRIKSKHQSSFTRFTSRKYSFKIKPLDKERGPVFNPFSTVRLSPVRSPSKLSLTSSYLSP